MTFRLGTFLQTLLTYFSRAWLYIANGIGSLVLIVIILIVALGLFSTNTTTEHISEKVLEPGGLDKIAVVNLSGPIVESAGSGDPLAFAPEIVASRRVLPLLDHIAKDDSIKAVVLRINSPGGAVVPSDEIYRKVLELREQKPVV